jgi:hypothetical protein
VQGRLLSYRIDSYRAADADNLDSQDVVFLNPRRLRPVPAQARIEAAYGKSVGTPRVVHACYLELPPG